MRGNQATLPPILETRGLDSSDGSRGPSGKPSETSVMDSCESESESESDPSSYCGCG